MMLIFVMVTFIFSVLFVLINFLVSELFSESKSPHSSFECGMENNILTRIPFSIQFFLIGLIFIIFDLEVIILLNFLPFSGSILVFISFIMFVMLSLLYEWKMNKLLWLK